MFNQRGPWLGQVRLVARPSLGTKPGAAPTFIDPTGRTTFRLPYASLTKPKENCVFVGLDNESGLESSLNRAKSLGYTEIHQTDLPPCEAPVDGSWAYFAQPWCSPIAYNLDMKPATKAVWACPGPDYERLQAEAKAKATQGCESLNFTSDDFQVPAAYAETVAAQEAAGRNILRVATGKILNEGSKSEQYQVEFWSCPPFGARPTATTSPPEPVGAGPAPGTLPSAPEASKLPLAAGIGVVGVVAALLAMK